MVEPHGFCFASIAFSDDTHGNNNRTDTADRQTGRQKDRQTDRQHTYVFKAVIAYNVSKVKVTKDTLSLHHLLNLVLVRRQCSVLFLAFFKLLTAFKYRQHGFQTGQMNSGLNDLIARLHRANRCTLSRSLVGMKLIRSCSCNSRTLLPSRPLPVATHCHCKNE